MRRKVLCEKVSQSSKKKGENVREGGKKKPERKCPLPNLAWPGLACYFFSQEKIVP